MLKNNNKQIEPRDATCTQKCVAKPALAQLSKIPTPAREAGPLRETEKEFLRCSKRAREILKLEESLKLGQSLDKARSHKLEKKEEAIQELVNSAKYLPGDSDLLEKNADIKEIIESQH